MAEYRNGRLQLPDVTLAAMTSVNIRATVKALEYSCRGIDFGAVTLLCHKRPAFLPHKIRYQHIDKIDEIDKFNYNCIYELWKYIPTDYMLLVHADGFVVNPSSWRDDFLKYDYIGSPFPVPPADDHITYRDRDGNLVRVGNSVSIRSRRLMEFPTKAHIPFEADHGYFNEDGFICVKNRHLFLEAGMTYAPYEVAKYFGQENHTPDMDGIRPFVFHKWAGPNAEYPDWIPKNPYLRKLETKLDLMG